MTRKQTLPITLSEAWTFFSSPKNLAKITPPYMNFRITNISGNEDEIYSGQLIRYRVNIIEGISTSWLTEITHVNAPFSFTDEQKSGPYSLWNHQHFFKEVNNGTEIIDEIAYAIPFGIVGRIANWMFVERRLNSIFDYRFRTLESLFAKQVIKQRK